MDEIVTGTSAALVPVFTGTLQSQPAQMCDARALHTFMGVLRDFSNWIKGRIRKFGFVEGVDFVTVENLSSPDLANAKSRIQVMTDYHLSLNMAKELSMVENNTKGREARRYFIDCEQKVLTQLSSNTCQLPTDTITPAQAQHLKELVDLVVESGKQGYPDTWSRLHRKMKVNSYLMLRQDQFDAAVEYLKGKFDDTSMAAIAAKHFPQLALPAPVVSLPSPVTTDLFAGLVQGDMIDHGALIKMQAVINQKVLITAFNNKDRGIGAEIAAKVKDMSPADLHTVNVAANMEVWLRTLQSKSS
jgi:phage anti-repressor protein